MSTLATDLRNQLERVVIEARDVAEAGARAALEALAVHHHEPYVHMKPEQRELRNHLRARARQLGDRQDTSGRLAIDHLVGECAYEHWHRMLFARFLAENSLLIEPDMDVAMSLGEAEELAKEEGVDVWVLASRCAQRMLPQIFRPDDPLLQIAFATEHMVELERLLDSLPPAVFTASDALGWVYQFWQSKKKDEVNRSEVKIGADEISAVTQLFTEPYMVEFLLHNTLGAWWAGRQLSDGDAAGAKDEDELRHKLALPGVSWEYLRFVRGEDAEDGPWHPAGGTFEGWPKQSKDVKVLDPCCGSGHFLVAALHHLVPIRMDEEGLSAAAAVDAVLRDNIHGLEIDERCCQIAAFALAFAAWTYPDAGGFRELPELHIACTGIGPQSKEDQWVKMAEESGAPMPADGSEVIRNGLLNLHRLFSRAPTLGSLINPGELPADLIAADYETIQPYLTSIREMERANDEIRERAIAAAGMVKAADLLAGEYTLVVTNVPYLARGKQAELLKDFLEQQYPDSKQDLATVFLSRSMRLCARQASVAMVTPQNWLFLATYRRFREACLERYTWHMLARLGSGAFGTITGEVVKAILICLTREPAVTRDAHRSKEAEVSSFAAIDVSALPSTVEKSHGLKSAGVVSLSQTKQLHNPASRVTLVEVVDGERLSDYADYNKGICTGDDARFRRCFWELVGGNPDWVGFQSTVSSDAPYGGLTDLLLWENGRGSLHDYVSRRLGGSTGAWLRGQDAWGRPGVTIKCIGDLPATLYVGPAFDSNVVTITPKNDEFLPTLWTLMSSPEYKKSVRALNQKLNVGDDTFVQVAFDPAHWRGLAAKQYPNGLPEPESDDPTQWLYHGHPNEGAEDAMLQVAVARLLGYRWPAELDPRMRLSDRARELADKCDELLEFADNDGIVCIPGVRGEDPAAERLLRLLTSCDIVPEGDLDDWIRSGFFQEHCKLFHNRPFVWHIWDGRKRDGFHALVNYHRLCEGDGKGRKLLESLTYSYLGDWIARCEDEVKRGEGGAEDRLAAAVELQDRLKAIIEGEPPFDLFVRWKSLHKQPIGWEPDVNDGVRINIRPLLASDLPNGRKGAGILRFKPNIHWKKDRGKEPECPMAEYPWFWGWDQKTVNFMGKGNKPDGNRWNACHYTTEAKQAARDAASFEEGKQ